MAYEDLKHSTLLNSLSAVIADLSDLVQKEISLGRAEISAKITTKLQASTWIAAAVLLGMLALLLLVGAAVAAIVSYGIAVYWACLIVAGLIGTVGGFAYYRGRQTSLETLVPTRTINQIKQDKEQLI